MIVASSEWIRGEVSYRVYIRGLRCAIVGFVGAGIVELLAAGHLIGKWVTIVLLLTFIGGGGLSVITGATAYVVLSSKKRFVGYPALYKTIYRDVFRGLPTVPAG
jgi:hypothetical protein